MWWGSQTSLLKASETKGHQSQMPVQFFIQQGGKEALVAVGYGCEKVMLHVSAGAKEGFGLLLVFGSLHVFNGFLLRHARDCKMVLELTDFAQGKFFSLKKDLTN